jgi:hypothetical protein
MLKCPIRVFKFSKKTKTLVSSAFHDYKGSKFSEIILYYDSDAQHYWFEVDRTYRNEFELLEFSTGRYQRCELLCYITNPENEEQSTDGNLLKLIGLS